MTKETVICKNCNKAFNLPEGRTKGFCVFCGAENSIAEGSFEKDLWIKEYIKEPDPLKRYESIVQELKNRPNDPDFTARLEIWNLRYVKGKKAIPVGDRFMQFWQTLVFYTRNSDSKFKMNQAKKDIAKFFEDSKIKAVISNPDVKADILYEELYNTISRYIICCKKDSHYGSVIMDLCKMNEETLIKKIQSELYKTGVLLFEKLELDKEYNVMLRAVQDAYSDCVTKVNWVK